MLALPTCPFLNDVHTERLESYGTYYHSFEFDIPADHPTAALAVEKGLVVFPDRDGVTKCFVIQTVDTETTMDGTFKRVFAEDSAVDELTSDVVVPPGEFTDDSATTILTALLAGTRWAVGDVEVRDIDTTSFEWADYPTTWACVLALAEHYQVEVSTRVDVAGSDIIARYVDLLSSRGVYSGAVLRYAGNTESVTRHGEGGEIYSRVYGLGAAQTDGTYLTFGTEEWTVAGGDPMEKPAGDTYLESDAVRLGDPGDPINGVAEIVGYGFPQSDGTVAHRVGVFRDPDEQEADWLLLHTYDYFMEHSKPQYTYDASVAAFDQMPAQRPGDTERVWERVRIGDSVGVVDTLCYPAYTDLKRVVEIRVSYSEPGRVSITLGTIEKPFSGYIKKLVKVSRLSDKNHAKWSDSVA